MYSSALTRRYREDSSSIAYITGVPIALPLTTTTTLNDGIIYIIDV